MQRSTEQHTCEITGDRRFFIIISGANMFSLGLTGVNGVLPVFRLNGRRPASSISGGVDKCQKRPVHHLEQRDTESHSVEAAHISPAQQPCRPDAVGRRQLIHHLGRDGAELKRADAAQVVDHNNDLLIAIVGVVVVLLPRLHFDVGAVCVGLVEKLLEHCCHKAWQSCFDAAESFFVVDAHADLDLVAKLIRCDITAGDVDMGEGGTDGGGVLGG